jgi:hypothetical protein
LNSDSKPVIRGSFVVIIDCESRFVCSLSTVLLENIFLTTVITAVFFKFGVEESIVNAPLD